MDIKNQMISIDHLCCFIQLLQIMNELDASFIQRKGDSSLTQLMIEKKQPPKITYHNRGRLTLTVGLLCISTYYFGFNLTNVATFTKATRVDVYGSIASTETMWGLIIGLFQVGGIFGSGITPQLMRFTTRKQLIVSVNLVGIVIFAICQVTNFWVLLAMRILEGVVAGSLLSMVPLYINEICPKQIVGVLGIFTQLFMIFACVVNYAVALIMDKVGVTPIVFARVQLSWGGCLNILLVILLLIDFIPESPKSLIRKNKNDQARQVIALFIVPDHVQNIYNQKLMEVTAESKRMQQEAQGEVDEKDKIQYSKKAILLGYQLPFMMQMAGIGGVITQANTIISKVLPSISMYTGVIVTGVQFVCNIFTMPVLAKFGRKQLILNGNLLLTIINFALAIFLIFDHWSPTGIIATVLLILFVAVFGLTMAPIRLYVPQIMPAKMVPLATMMNWLGASITTIFTPMIIEANDGNAFPAFFMFGGTIGLCYIYNVLVMVETKGRSTKQIAEAIAGKLQK